MGVGSNKWIFPVFLHVALSHLPHLARNANPNASEGFKGTNWRPSDAQAGSPRCFKEASCHSLASHGNLDFSNFFHVSLSHLLHLPPNANPNASESFRDHFEALRSPPVVTLVSSKPLEASGSTPTGGFSLTCCIFRSTPHASEGSKGPFCSPQKPTGSELQQVDFLSPAASSAER